MALRRRVFIPETFVLSHIESKMFMAENMYALKCNKYTQTLYIQLYINLPPNAVHLVSSLWSDHLLFLFDISLHN